MVLKITFLYFEKMFKMYTQFLETSVTEQRLTVQINNRELGTEVMNLTFIVLITQRRRERILKK